MLKIQPTDEQILSINGISHDCQECKGSGIVPVCCGSPVVGAQYMGQTEMVCCGNPEPEHCSACSNSASPRATGCPDTMDDMGRFAVDQKAADEEKSPPATGPAG